MCPQHMCLRTNGKMIEQIIRNIIIPQMCGNSSSDMQKNSN